jgi:regulator of RNase E activity RraA
MSNIQNTMDEHDLLAACGDLDTASLSDALDSLRIAGGIHGIVAHVPAARCVGFAYTVQYEPISDSSTFRNAANYIDDVPSHSVIVSSNGGRTDCTIWGDILTHVAVRKRIRGTVIDGAARDIATVRKFGYPLFSRAVYMQSGKNRAMLRATQVPIQIEGVAVHPGDLIACDENGCLVIPRRHAAQVIQRARAIEQTEARIISAVNDGASLAAARDFHRYDQPWLPAAGANAR